MKELLTWLSIIAFAQVLLIGVGGAFLREIFTVEVDRFVMLVAGVFSLVLFVVITVLYSKVFILLKEKRKWKE